MKSFKQYASSTNEKTVENISFSPEEMSPSEHASAQDLTQKIASAYHGKSNADMLKGILQEAEKSKRAGTLSNEEIENFYLAFSPMLDATQRKRLRAIIDKLKEI